MDASRFDRFTRALTVTTSRRGGVRVLTGLTLAGVLLPRFGLTGVAGKKKRCDPCQIRKNGKCKGLQPDDTPCRGAGKCFAGTCNPRPACPPYGSPCSGDTGLADCCSGICRLVQIGATEGTCTFGELGAACISATDCHPRYSCVGYRCQ